MAKSNMAGFMAKFSMAGFMEVPSRAGVSTKYISVMGKSGKTGFNLQGNGIVKSSRACNRKDGGMAMGSQSVL